VLTSVVVLLAVIGSGYAEPTAYETVRSAPRLAIGGVGVAGVTSSEELAMRKLRDNQRGDELRKLLREATPAGQMYALFALRQINARDYEELSEPYRHSSAVITRVDGCIIHPEVISQTVEWIDKWAVKIKSWERKT
jgi:hypothetical protein